jgi:hypothetical protein
VFPKLCVATHRWIAWTFQWAAKISIFSYCFHFFPYKSYHFDVLVCRGESKVLTNVSQYFFRRFSVPWTKKVWKSLPVCCFKFLIWNFRGNFWNLFQLFSVTHKGWETLLLMMWNTSLETLTSGAILQQEVFIFSYEITKLFLNCSQLLSQKFCKEILQYFVMIGHQNIAKFHSKIRWIFNQTTLHVLLTNLLSVWPRVQRFLLLSSLN